LIQRRGAPGVDDRPKLSFAFRKSPLFRIGNFPPPPGCVSPRDCAARRPAALTEPPFVRNDAIYSASNPFMRARSASTRAFAAKYALLGSFRFRTLSETPSTFPALSSRPTMRPP
jgi:hypothetical protein